MGTDVNLLRINLLHAERAESVENIYCLFNYICVNLRYLRAKEWSRRLRGWAQIEICVVELYLRKSVVSARRKMFLQYLRFLRAKK